MTMQRMPIPVGQKFDPTSPKHVDTVLAAIDPALYGTGWKIEHYDQADGKLYVTRQDAVSSVEAGDRDDEKRVRLGPEYGPGDGEKVAKRFESIPDFAGYVMTHYDSYRAVAHLAKLSPDEVRCRDAVAMVVGAKPWEVRVSKRRGGGFHVGLPKTYTPSKHDIKLDEVITTAVGAPGWYSRIDVPKLTMEIIPSTQPTFPSAIPYPLELAGKVNTQQRLIFGQSLGPTGDEDGKPLSLTFSQGPHSTVNGTTGAGKLLTLDTRIPTPTGWTTMGELEVGSRVLGRDGKPCSVTFLSDIVEEPVLYRVTLTDGQEIFADRDHQWVVSSHYQRNYPRRRKAIAQRARHERLLEVASLLRRKATGQHPQTYLTAAQVTEITLSVPGTPWRGVGGVRAALEFMDVPSSLETRLIPRRRQRASAQHQVSHVYSLAAALTAVANAPRRVGARSGSSRASSPAAIQRSDVAARVLTSVQDKPATARDIARMLAQHGAPEHSTDTMRSLLQRLDVPHTVAPIATEISAHDDHEMRREVRVYPARAALAALADRVRFLAHEAPKLDASESVVTTGEMLAAGVALPSGQSRFAIRRAEPLDLPTAKLTLAPYTLGAWLGDGSSDSGAITSMDPEVIDQVVGAGFPVRRREQKPDNRASTYYFEHLYQALIRAGVSKSGDRKGKLDKRIPSSYLRASYEQRLALLQGLMDTDGTIDNRGRCEISLNKRDLAFDVLELIRTMGIRTSIRPGKSSYKRPDGTEVVTGTRYRMTFSTTLPVFLAIPRLVERLPADVTEERWVYITDIEPAPAAPGRCIQVDSTDSTYLCADFVPTHNTATINALIFGALQTGMELVIVDVPHKAVDYLWCKPFVRDGGWGCESLEHGVASLKLTYEEGERRAATLKRYGVQRVDQLPKHEQDRMPTIFIVIDELSGLLQLTDKMAALPKAHPERVAADRENMLHNLLLGTILKLAAEMRFVGIRLLLSTQVADSTTGIPPKLRTLLSNKILLGVNATEANRGKVFSDPSSVPAIPDNIRADPKAGRGVGAAEMEGVPPTVFKGYFREVPDYEALFVRMGLPQSSAPEPTEEDCQRLMSFLYEDEDGNPIEQLKVEVKRYAGGPLANDPDAGSVDQNGNRLTGAAAAAAASKRHANV